jgi:predicted small lipoprotein YifL
MAASRTTFAFVVLAMGLALAGCGDKEPQASDAPAQSSTPPAPGSAIDGCKLISADDIARLLGKPVEGRPLGADPQMPACTWENRDTYESVTLEIGNPGTAVNTVQVAVLNLLGEAADNAAIDLARKIGPQLPQ